MGQVIQVETTELGDVVIYSTDRSITGQDGVSYSTAEAAAGDESFPARLAARLFATAGTIQSVFIASNQVVVKADEPFEAAATDELAGVIGDFFLFYPAA